MFAVGLPGVSASFFSAATLVITILAGIQIFAWIGTIWDGRPVWKTPFLSIVGFIVIAVKIQPAGALSGDRAPGEGG